MEYDRVFLAQGSVRSADDLAVAAGSHISSALTLGQENNLVVIDGDLEIGGELSVDDGQGLVVLGTIRAGQFFSGDSELFAHSVGASDYVAIDYVSGGLVQVATVEAPVVVHDSGHWTPPFTILADRSIKVGHEATPPLAKKYARANLYELAKALKAKRPIWSE